MSIFSKFVKNAVSKLVITAFLVQTVNPAFAAGPVSSGATPADILSVQGDQRITHNENGSVIAKIPAGERANQVFALSSGSPILWGRYYPETHTGSLMASIATRDMLTGEVTLKIDILTPGAAGNPAGAANSGDMFKVGNGIKSVNGGKNPFADFVEPSGRPIWAGVSQEVFSTAMSVFAKKYSSTRGYLAVAEQAMKTESWDECTKSFLGMCVKRAYHNEWAATIKPVWYVMAPYGNADGRATTYNQNAFKPSNCVGSTANCVVLSAMGFTKVQTGGDFPDTPSQVFHQHDVSAGWNFLAYVLLAIVIGVVTAGAGLVAMTMLEAGAAAGAGYAGLSYINQGGHAQSLQSGFFGSVSDGVAIPAASDPHISPAGCVTGATTTSGNTKGQGHLGLPGGAGECVAWLTDDLRHDTTAVGNFFDGHKQAEQSATRLEDVVVPDVKILREAEAEGVLPTRNWQSGRLTQ